MVSRSSKLILLNAVKNSESHNKRAEEREMWHQRKRELNDKERKSYSPSPSKKRMKSDLLYNNVKSAGFLKSSYSSTNTSKQPVKTSNKWTAELMKYEESLGSERWGHGGYKELYPEEFNNSSRDAEKRLSGEPLTAENTGKFSMDSKVVLSDNDSSQSNGSARKIKASRKKRKHKDTRGKKSKSKKNKEHKKHKKKKEK